MEPRKTLLALYHLSRQEKFSWDSEHADKRYPEIKVNGEQVSFPDIGDEAKIYQKFRSSGMNALIKMEEDMVFPSKIRSIHVDGVRVYFLDSKTVDWGLIPPIFRSDVQEYCKKEDIDIKFFDDSIKRYYVRWSAGCYDDHNVFFSDPYSPFKEIESHMKGLFVFVWKKFLGDGVVFDIANPVRFDKWRKIEVSNCLKLWDRISIKVCMGTGSAKLEREEYADTTWAIKPDPKLHTFMRFRIHKKDQKT